MTKDQPAQYLKKTLFPRKIVSKVVLCFPVKAFHTNTTDPEVHQRAPIKAAAFISFSVLRKITLYKHKLREQSNLNGGLSTGWL